MSDPQDDDFPLVNGSAGGVVARHRRRERLGRLVRDVWIAWAQEQPSPKPSWLVSWEDLTEPDREVDRRIGERLAREGRDERISELTILRAALAAEREAHAETKRLVGWPEDAAQVTRIDSWVSGPTHDALHDRYDALVRECAEARNAMATADNAARAALRRAERAEAACAEMSAAVTRLVHEEGACRCDLENGGPMCATCAAAALTLPQANPGAALLAERDALRATVERLERVRAAVERLRPSDLAPRYSCECTSGNRCDECELRGALRSALDAAKDGG